MTVDIVFVIGHHLRNIHNLIDICIHVTLTVRMDQGQLIITISIESQDMTSQSMTVTVKFAIDLQ